MIRPRKGLVIGSIIVFALLMVIGQRVYSNVTANKERAQRASQGQAVAVETMVVKKGEIIPVFKYPSSLEAAWSAQISSKVEGRIDRLNVDEGDKVAAGAVIAVLDTEELVAQVVQAEGNVFQARANMQQAEFDLKRNEHLFQQGAISAHESDNVRTRHRVASGLLRVAEGNLSLLETKLNNAVIDSPRSGVVTTRHLQAGYYVKVGEPIVTVADVNNLLAKATIGEGQILEIAVGDEVKIRVEALNGKEFTGKVARLSPAATLPSRSFTAEIAVEDDEHVLKPGMFANVYASGKIKKNILVVPETALVMREDMKTVYAVLDDNKVQQKTLKVGVVGGGLVEVLEGLSEGERIVVSGQNKLRDGAAVKEGSL